MSGLRCWLGHKWASYDVSWTDFNGNRVWWPNDLCERCDVPRNPLILAEQVAGLRSGRACRVSGEHRKARA